MLAIFQIGPSTPVSHSKVREHTFGRLVAQTGSRSSIALGRRTLRGRRNEKAFTLMALTSGCRLPPKNPRHTNQVGSEMSYLVTVVGREPRRFLLVPGFQSHKDGSNACAWVILVGRARRDGVWRLAETTRYPAPHRLYDPETRFQPESGLKDGSQRIEMATQHRRGSKVANGRDVKRLSQRRHYPKKSLSDLSLATLGLSQALAISQKALLELLPSKIWSAEMKSPNSEGRVHPCVQGKHHELI